MTPPRGPIRWLDRLRLTEPKPEESAAWEIEHHIEEATDRLVEDGWDREAARAEAERRFGDHSRYAPSMRRMEKGRMAMERRTRGWDFFRQGLGAVMRTGWRYPGFTLGIVVTLGLGIGANATMYGIVDRLLLQPPEHVVEADRVRLIFGERPHLITGEMAIGSTMTYPDYADLREHTGMDVAAFTGAFPVTVGTGEDAGRVEHALATASFFTVLGVQPRMGRFFSDEETEIGAALTAVVSEEYWSRELGEDAGVLGRTLEVEGRPVTIIGVAPRGFTGVDLAPVDLWLPLEPTHVLRNGGEGCMNSRGCWWMRTVARLHEGVTDEAAEAEATALHLNGWRERIEQGRYSDQSRIVLGPVIAGQGPEASEEARVARWLAGVSAIVLLIACANVANLLMARGVRRERETAVRMALGASRGRVVAQAIVEAVALSGVGAVLALVIARWGGSLIRSVLLPGVYFPNESWSGRLVGFTALAAVTAGVVAGVGPALQGRRTELTGSLRAGARGASGGRSRLRGALTVAQAAMSVVLLVGAGLFVRSLGELRSLDLGLDVDRLLLAQLEFTRQDIDIAERSALYEEAARRVAQLPGVTAGAPIGVPFQWAYSVSLDVPGVDSLPRLPGGGPYVFPITPTYFETVGVALRRGRGIEATDRADGDPVAVVSETMAQSLWPAEDALGKCLMVGDDAEGCTTVVGVAEDAARGGYQDEPFMAYYVPYAQSPENEGMQGMYVRVDGDVRTMAAEVVAELRALSPEVRFAEVSPLRELLDPQARAWTLGAMMFSVFGLLALCVAAIGLYSALAFDVAQRTRELGIRGALGARKEELMRSVLWQGARTGVVGVLLGGGIAWVAAPYAGDLLFRVSPRDPAVLGSVALLLVGVCALASVVPGLRATGVDPARALSSD